MQIQPAQSISRKHSAQLGDSQHATLHATALSSVALRGPSSTAQNSNQQRLISSPARAALAACGRLARGVINY